MLDCLLGEMVFCVIWEGDVEKVIWVVLVFFMLVESW